MLLKKGAWRLGKIKKKESSGQRVYVNAQCLGWEAAYYKMSAMIMNAAVGVFVSRHQHLVQACSTADLSPRAGSRRSDKEKPYGVDLDSAAKKAV